MRVRGKIKFKLKYRPKLQGGLKRKIARVSGVRIDQAVTCPNCGTPMLLSPKPSTFQCKRCARELTAEQALAILEMAGA